MSARRGRSADAQEEVAFEAAAEIARFERMGFETWPALEVHVFDGWQLRIAGGVTGRSNSVQVLESTPAAPERIEERVDRCERFYRERGLPVRFKLTAAAQPPGLDARLAERGYRRVSSTRVQALHLEGESGAGSQATRHRDPRPAGGPVAHRIRIVEDVRDERWRSTNARLNGVPEAARAVLAAMHARIDRPLCATCEAAGRDVAVGLGALASGWLFLGEIATDPDLRRRGCARALVDALVERGRQAGAEGAWLQVVDGNDAALALYRRLGFRDRYTYWYRLHG